MPIAPPSQIGLDILRSPALPEIAAARAEMAKRQSGAATEAFSLGSTGDAKGSVEADKPVTPASFKRFEAMVLQTFIQNMLPKDGAAVYGKGMAGDMWKSLLAEKVAESWPTAAASASPTACSATVMRLPARSEANCPDGNGQPGCRRR